MKQRVFLFPFYKWDMKAMNDLISGVFANLGIHLDPDFSFFPHMFFAAVSGFIYNFTSKALTAAAAVMLRTSASQIQRSQHEHHKMRNI